MTDTPPAVTRETFHAAVARWLATNAPLKGDPDDFSSVHTVSASRAEEYRDRERRALEVTRA